MDNDVPMNIYLLNRERKYDDIVKRSNYVKSKLNEFKIGDKVRVYKDYKKIDSGAKTTQDKLKYNIFDKSGGRWSREIYTIINIDHNSVRLDDNNIYFLYEIQKIKNPYEEETKNNEINKTKEKYYDKTKTKIQIEKKLKNEGVSEKNIIRRKLRSEKRTPK